MICPKQLLMHCPLIRNNQRRQKPVNKIMTSNNKRPVIIGAFCGLILSVVLCFTQNIDFMLYFSGAPYYINSLMFERKGFVSITTFIYFIGLFSLIGYF